VGIALRPCADAPYMRRFAVSAAVSPAVNDERGWPPRWPRQRPAHVRPVEDCRATQDPVRFRAPGLLRGVGCRWMRFLADKPVPMMISYRADYTRVRPSPPGCLVGRPRLPPSASSLSTDHRRPNAARFQSRENSETQSSPRTGPTVCTRFSKYSIPGSFTAFK